MIYIHHRAPAMNTQTVFIFALIRFTTSTLRDFSNCHDDFTLKPPDGVVKRNTFTWLAFVQYIHVTTGLPHHSKAPRVMLVQKQFVVGTAIDLLRLPKNYKLGDVVFGEYEREEEDCGLTKLQIKFGARCAGAYLEIPVLEITPHPEYSRFGVGNSLALVKLLRPMKSRYMVPICLPSLRERTKKKRNKAVFMVDYVSSVPTDFESEMMGKKTLKLYTHKECRRHRMKSKLGSEGVTHVLCTSGCGVRPGAPIISHNTEGSFELIGVAAGGAPCTKRSMRERLIKEPPLYIDVYPYSIWIVNVITANELPQSFPQTYSVIARKSNSVTAHKEFLRSSKPEISGWRGRTFVSGKFCFKRQKSQNKKSSMFYFETFEVNTSLPARLQIFMKLSAGIACKIVCARLLLPNRLQEPKILGVGRYNISVEFETDWFPFSFYYTLGLLGKNSTKTEMEEWFEERN